MQVLSQLKTRVASPLFPKLLLSALVGALVGPAVAQTAAPQAGAPAKLSDHVLKDVTRHRALAAAHEAAARCLESGKTEEFCIVQLQAACKGLGIGKYCGLKHEH